MSVLYDNNTCYTAVISVPKLLKSDKITFRTMKLMYEFTMYYHYVLSLCIITIFHFSVELFLSCHLYIY